MQKPKYWLVCVERDLETNERYEIFQCSTKDVEEVTVPYGTMYFCFVDGEMSQQEIAEKLTNVRIGHIVTMPEIFIQNKPIYAVGQLVIDIDGNKFVINAKNRTAISLTDDMVVVDI